MAAAIPAKFRAKARRDAAAFFLGELAKGLRAGVVMVRFGQHERGLASAESVLLDIEVRERKRINEVHIKLRWPTRPLIRTAGAPTDGHTPPGEQHG